MLTVSAAERCSHQRGRLARPDGQSGCRCAVRSICWLAAVVLAAAGLLWPPPTPALAQAGPCGPDRPPVAVRPVAPVANGADLPAPFGYRPPAVDQAALLRDVATVVTQQAAELGVDTCFQRKPEQIVARVDFLSPFEFLVVSALSQDPERRDALLDRYAADPRAAIRELGPVFPSTRAQVVLTTYAYYDVETDRIRVNAAQVPPAELRRVLVHEFWHAMPRLRTWTDPGGATLRASGFWLQEQRDGPRTWVPVEDRRGLPYSPYLLDEAMAALMETRYAGPPRFSRPEVDQAQAFLARLMEVAGPREVVRGYLDSQPDELAALIAAHRAQLPEQGVYARP